MKILKSWTFIFARDQKRIVNKNISEVARDNHKEQQPFS